MALSQTGFLDSNLDSVIYELVGPKASHLNSVNLNFLLCKKGMVIQLYLTGSLLRLP